MNRSGFLAMISDTLKKRLPSGQRQPTTNAGRYATSALVRAAGEFAQLERPSHREVSTFKELFYTLALRSRNNENRELSALLARSSFTPRPIALFFAMHDIEAATPMLRYSPVLSEADLISIVRKLKGMHAQVIAQRGDVTEQLASAVLSVDGSNKLLLTTLLGNSALGDKPEIQKMLHSAQLVKSVTPVRTMQEQPSRSPLDEIMLDHQQTDLSEALLSLAARGGKLGQRSTSIPQAELPSLSPLQAQLLRASRNLNREAFAFCIEEVCGLKPETTLKALQGKDTGFIATILAAMKMPRKEASQILLLMTPDVGRNLRVFQLVLDRFSSMNRDDCILYLEGLGAAFPGDTKGDRFARFASKRKRGISSGAETSNTIHRYSDTPVGEKAATQKLAPAPRVANAR